MIQTSTSYKTTQGSAYFMRVSFFDACIDTPLNMSEYSLFIEVWDSLSNSIYKSSAIPATGIDNNLFDVFIDQNLPSTRFPATMLKFSLSLKNSAETEVINLIDYKAIREDLNSYKLNILVNELVSTIGEESTPFYSGSIENKKY